MIHPLLGLHETKRWIVVAIVVGFNLEVEFNSAVEKRAKN